MEIKVLVADDELPARGELKYQLASMPHVNVIGECANGKEVISFIYDDARYFNKDGKAKVKLNGETFFIDVKGNWVE